MLDVGYATKLRIAECFLSLQGEGRSIGRPAHFIRLQGCSVGCRWCDTKYTWAPEDGEALALPDLENRLSRMGKAGLLVITGGEPLENSAFPALVEWASCRWDRVEIETSGLRPPPPLPPNTWWNWSPKLPSATPKADATWRHATEFVRSGRYACKVVVDSRDDWQEACARLAERRIPSADVVIMPQGMQRDELLNTARWLAPLVIERGFTLGSRLHIDLWGAKRGI